MTRTEAQEAYETETGEILADADCGNCGEPITGRPTVQRSGGFPHHLFAVCPGCTDALKTMPI